MGERNTVGIAVVGCGFVADFYMDYLELHADRLRLVGAFDRDGPRLASFSRMWGGKAYDGLDDLLADPDVDIVVNLTDPENHAGVTRRAIEAGHHVYSEKPLGMTTSEARCLRDAADAKGVRLAAAPSNVLGEQAQTLIKAVRDGVIGQVRLVYAEIDDGMIHKAPHQTWRSRTGKIWPAHGEFEVGCTYEHAGYVASVLVAMFGPVRRITAFSGLLMPKKGQAGRTHPYAPDFSTGCLEFEGGIVARLTNSIVGSYNHEMSIFGDKGALQVEETWDFAGPVRMKATSKTRLDRIVERRFPRFRGKVVKPVRAVPFRGGRGSPTMDFLRGIRELADAIVEDRPCRMTADLAVHITEIVETLQHPERFTRPATLTSTAEPMLPMPWAE